MLTKKQIKNIDLWIEALLSGKYKQTQGVLNNLETGGMCCLGVYQDAVAGTKWEAGTFKLDGIETEIGFFIWDGDRRDILPSAEFLGGHTGLSESAQGKLAGMNDDGNTFAEIVETIRLFVKDPTKHADYVEEDVWNDE